MINVFELFCPDAQRVNVANDTNIPITCFNEFQLLLPIHVIMPLGACFYENQHH